MKLLLPHGTGTKEGGSEHLELDSGLFCFPLSRPSPSPFDEVY